MNAMPYTYPDKREQQEDFVNGNLIHSEQGVRNTVYVPGSSLIAFGFVQIWLLLTCSIREGAEDKIWKKLHHIETSRQHCEVQPFRSSGASQQRCGDVVATRS